MSVDWTEYERFKEVDHKYLPREGEGTTMANQITAAVSKLVVMWYRNDDVFDNTYKLKRGCNDLSNYANWLDKYVPEAHSILRRIIIAEDDSDYEDMLLALCDKVQTMDYLKDKALIPAIGSIYECDGPYDYVD